MHEISAEPPEQSGVTRRSVFVAAAGIVVAGVGAPGATAAAVSGRGHVGAAGAANGLEFLGEISQVGDALTGYGYLTAVSGLAVEQLHFGEGERSEATARFSFHSTAQLISIQRRDGVFVAHAQGHLEIYLRDVPGATFDDPSTFAQGHRIAADDATFENILNVTAENVAVVNLFGDLRRAAVSSFTLDGTKYHLGRIGLRSRLVAAGKGTRTDPVAPKSILIIGGNVTNPEQSPS
jgi:hypothetical protein